MECGPRELKPKRCYPPSIGNEIKTGESWPTPEILICQDFILREEFKAKIKEVLPEVLKELGLIK